MADMAEWRSHMKVLYERPLVDYMIKKKLETILVEAYSPNS
jgi:hypothetical protein